LFERIAVEAARERRSSWGHVTTLLAEDGRPPADRSFSPGRLCAAHTVAGRRIWHRSDTRRRETVRKQL